MTPGSELKFTKEIIYQRTKDIQFSQASVAATFSDGSLVRELTTNLLFSTVKVTDIPPIRILSFHNTWYALDNRRLRAFKDALIPTIPVMIVSLRDEKIKQEFFTKKTNKSLAEGGTTRNTAKTNSQHFEDGVYVFTKIVLNWTMEQLNSPYHNSVILPLCLQDTLMQTIIIEVF